MEQTNKRKRTPKPAQEKVEKVIDAVEVKPEPMKAEPTPLELTIASLEYKDGCFIYKADKPLMHFNGTRLYSFGDIIRVDFFKEELAMAFNTLVSTEYLVEKLLELVPEADKEDVVKRLNIVIL